MDIDAYLDRIGLAERPPATLAGLNALHTAHLRAVPYENFDVQLGTPITIDIPTVYEKIVTRRRGGWCYEMNGILGWALGELGFSVKRATGAVMRKLRGDAVVGNHLVLRVDLAEGRYLADAGFGDGPLEPFAVREGPFTSGGFAYEVQRLNRDWWRLESFTGAGARCYDFRIKPADEALLGRMCQMLQTAPDSPFVQVAFAFRHTPDGIRILRGRSLLDVRPGQPIETRELANADDLVETLHTIFALDLPEAATLWPRIVERHAAFLAAQAAT